MSAIKKLSLSETSGAGRKPARSKRTTYAEIEPPVSQSLAMRRLLSQASETASTVAPVFIFGEAGSGKRWLAAEICRLSGDGAVTLDSRRLRGIYEDEGSEAFAAELKSAMDSGVGTIIVHRVEELTLPLQRAVFKTLLSPENRRIILTSVASQRDLRLGGRWMPGFFEAFDWFFLEVPPLRARMEDLPGLARYFAKVECGRQIEDAAVESLSRRKFPGNLRELKELIQNASLQHLEGEAITKVGDESSYAGDFVMMKPFQSFSFNEHVEAFEKHLIMLGLRHCEGNQSATARLLDMSRQTLIMKMKRFDLL